MSEDDDIDLECSLEGRFLVAMPTIGDPRFERTLIYMCAHSEQGAMGLVINRLADNVTFPDLLEQLDITRAQDAGQAIRVHVGGPVEPGMGFVLHSDEYAMSDSTLSVGPGVGLTATVDILRAIANGDGPQQSLLALGYACWAPGQLESEIEQNGWLICDADEGLLFDDDLDSKWIRAMTKIGVDLARLSGQSGRA